MRDRARITVCIFPNMHGCTRFGKFRFIRYTQGSLALVHDMNSKMAHRFALGGTFMEPG